MNFLLLFLQATFFKRSFTFQRLVGCLFILGLFFYLSLNSSLLLAESSNLSARDTVVKMLRSLKETGNYGVVLDYIHWPTAYKNLSQEEIKGLKLNSPSDLQRHLRSMVSDPTVFLREQYSQMIKNVPKDKQADYKKAFQFQIDRVKKEQAAMSERLKYSKFTIIKVEENGEQSKVFVRAQTPNADDTKPLVLKKIDGAWYMVTDYFVNNR